MLPARPRLPLVSLTALSATAALILITELLPVGLLSRMGADLAVSQPGENLTRRYGAGAVTILYGSAKGLTGRRSRQVPEPAGTFTYAGFGTALAVGDLDGDGYPDLAVGAPGDLVSDRSTREPLAPYGGSSPEMGAIVKGCQERGMLPFSNYNRIHVVPPLTTTDDEAREGLAILDAALTAAAG